MRLVLAGHTDTVPVNGNDRARIDGDTLWGLGAADMKSGLAVMLELARTVSEPAVDVTYVFYAAEEIASQYNGLGHLFTVRPELLAGDVAILGEPTGAVVGGWLPRHDALRGPARRACGPTALVRGWDATRSTGSDGCSRSSRNGRAASR